MIRDPEETEFLAKIRDDQKAKSIFEIVKHIGIDGCHISLEWLDRHEWRVGLGVDSIGLMSAGRISEAIQSLEIPLCYAAITDPEWVKLSVYEVYSTPDGIYSTSQHFLSAVDVAIFDTKTNFTVLHDSGYFYLVAGPQSFVQQSFGVSLKFVSRVFREYAEDSFHAENERTRLIAIHERYRIFMTD